MLYIFLVESGSMMTFDMNLALQTVANLKKAIASQCQIPEEKQVLLISGGESLNLTSRVCSYSCSGTDTSPIFLFSKNSIESPNPPKCVTDYDPDVDMSDRVQSCIDMNPNYNTVVARAEMAQQLYDMAKQQLHSCERLVHDQHLQQQGWAAVVANLEDIANSFTNTAQQLEQMFHNFIEDKSFYSDLLQNFSNDLKTLLMIPILDNLVSNNGNSNESNCGDNNSLTLLEWISQKDNQNSLEQVSEYCCRGLEQFNLEELSKIKEEVEEAIDSCNQSNMKEVKGLEERLYGLEKLMCEAKKIVEEQRDLAQAFYQNQTRASNLRDPSILPDLCASHQQQLQVMLKNHQKLRDYRRRCVRAKEELSGNLHARLRWIVFIEKKLSEIDSKVLIYRENLRRLKKHLEVVHQIHLSPKIYLASVVEVVRRKTFSNIFLNWATDMSQQSSKLIENEIQSRQTFSSQLNSHFLQILFPGMNDFPPRFANESPLPFDTNLPDLNESDVEYLRQKLPDLCDLLSVPLPVPMPQTSAHNNLSVSSVKPKSSESDIEEFETVVNQEFEDKQRDKSNENSKDVFTEMSATILDINELETNLKNFKTQLEEKTNKLIELETNYEGIQNELNLKNNSFKSLSNLSFECLTALKDIKTSFGSDFINIRNEYLNCFESMRNQLNDWISLKDREITEIQLNFNKTVDEYENQIIESNATKESMKSEINSLKDIIENLNKTNDSLNKELIDNNKEILKLKEEIIENKKQMTLEHELEMTSLNEELTQLSSSNQKLEDSINEKVSQMDSLKQNYEKLESDLLIKLEEEKDSLRSALKQEFDEKLDILNNEFYIKIKEMQTNKESALNELQMESEAEKTKCLIELKDQLDSEHKHELESLRHRFKLAISTTSIERTPSETSLEKVNLDLVDQLAQEREVMKLKQLILDEKNRYEELLIKFKKEKDEEIKNIRSSIQAERQVNFNEALNKLSNERHLLVQESKTKQKWLQSSISVINNIISKYNSIQTDERLESLSNEIIEQIETEIKSLATNFGTDSNESIICDSKFQCSCNSVNIIKEKELEINRLNRLLRDCDMTQSSSAIGRIERVSVLGCEVGDIVVIYYEEKFDNYIVLHLNNVLHFLNTDCLDSLGLKCGTGEDRKHWTIAEVTDKEYCQARKAQNRYRVAINTKFYRVKAKSWSRLTNPSNKLAENRSIFSSQTTFFGKESMIQSSASMIASNVSVSPIDTQNSPEIK